MSLLPTDGVTPAIGFAPELLLIAQGVKVAIFDVDGVLTDGGLYFAENADDDGVRESIKRFHILDGQGLKLLQQADITPVIVTGRDSKPLRTRLAQLGVDAHACFGVSDKRAAVESVLATLGLDWRAAAAMGDDWPDLPVLRRCAFGCAPPGAHIEVRAAAQYVTRAAAGHGAAREFCDLLLVASGHYARLLAEHAR
ncbi:MAG: HAD hydrolase family protein [Burkholderiales bacterium]